MILPDTRTLVLSMALTFLSLAAARLVSRRTYRSVPGHSAWTLSDALIGVGAVFLALRGGPISLGASLFGSYVFILGGAELRYRGVRQFCGLTPPALVSLLPYFIVLITRLLPSPSVRAALFDLTMTYVGIRTAWALLRSKEVSLFSEIRVLGVVAGLTAVGSLAQAIILMARPMAGNIFLAAPWFLAVMACLSIIWSFLSLGLASGWIEARRVAALEAQRKSDERSRVLLEESPIPTVVLTPEGAFEQVNRKFVESTGFTLDDVPDEEHWWALACPDLERRGQARSVWHEVIQRADTNAPKGPHSQIVVDFRKAPSRTLELHVRRVDDRLLMMLVDVTQLNAAVRAREEMMAAVSHELRSPLAAIRLGSQVLTETCSRGVAAYFRSLLYDRARPTGHRARIAYCKRSRRSTRRQDLGDERAGKGQHLLVHAASRAYGGVKALKLKRSSAAAVHNHHTTASSHSDDNPSIGPSYSWGERGLLT
jgi:PAS domain S-box-containing protein